MYQSSLFPIVTWASPDMRGAKDGRIREERFVVENPHPAGTAHPEIAPQIVVRHGPVDISLGRKVVLGGNLPFRDCKFRQRQIVIDDFLILSTETSG